MNGLEEVLKCIEEFICEKEQIKKQITELEEKRTQLAQIRNEKKRTNRNAREVNELGRQISEFGNQSQELQNKLDSNACALKSKVNLMIDNFVAEGIRKIRIINQEIQELDEKISNQKDRNEKYQLQRQEFYLRFGRMPELSERAAKEKELQEKETEKSISQIKLLEQQVDNIETEITTLAKTKREIKNGNWNSIIKTQKEAETEGVYIEELNIEEIEPIEEIHIEEFEPIEELYIEEFKPVEEIKVEKFEEIGSSNVEVFETVEETSSDEIEALARAIVEEIAIAQSMEFNVEEDEKAEDIADDIIIFEQEENAPKSKVIIPLFGQKATISNIIIKIENEELVYKAQMSDEREIKIHPSQLGEESVLLRDKQNREDCKEILINYAIKEHRVLDKKVINMIDPLVCELLIECAERYKYDAQELVYNYAMSFSEGDSEFETGIVYNLSYIEQSKLSKKEKAIIKKVCRSARKNNRIDIIESVIGFKKIKYLFKRIFAINNVKVLPEAKY